MSLVLLGLLALAAPVPAPPEPPALPEPPLLPEPPTRPEVPEATEPGSIRWSVPAGCPTVPEVRRGIERRLGRTLAAGEANVEGRVEATRSGDSPGHRLVLRTTTGGLVDERVLEAADCRALADATALVVALAIDPVAVAETMAVGEVNDVEDAPPPASPAPALARREATTTPERARDEVGDAEGEVERPRSRRPGGVVRVAGGAGLGALPGVTGVPAVAAGLRWSRARLEVEGAYWIPRTSAPIDGASVRVQLGTAAVRGCGQLGRDRLEAPLCGGVQLGGMRGAGQGAPAARTAQGLWVALEAGMGLSWRFASRWALSGGFTAAVPLVEPAFELVDMPPVRLFEPASVVGHVWLGIELRLGSP